MSITIKKLVIFLSIILFLILILKNCKEEKYSYNYTRLSRQDIRNILSKSQSLCLRDYINILNSTNNLNQLSLQELCNNLICQETKIENTDQFMSFLNTVSGECIQNCMAKNDWYKLALINLKINGMFDILNGTELVYKRALTNGVYSADSINIYFRDVQKTVGELVRMFSFDKGVSKENKENKEIYDFINSIISGDNPIIKNNLNNNNYDMNVIDFSMISSLSLINIFNYPKLKC